MPAYTYDDLILALAHERSSGAITSRLVRLGRLQLPQKAPGGESA